MERKNPYGTGTLLKLPDKFKFGDKVRYKGNTVFAISKKEGVVIKHENIVCPMSHVVFADGTTGYISDNELELVEVAQ